jgi:hypothetical protein
LSTDSDGRPTARRWSTTIEQVDDECAEELLALLGQQNGVVSRRQVEQLGGRPSDLRRLVRRRELARALPGVFLDHTGPPSWIQRAWVGVLYFWPAALDGESAIRVVAGPGWRHHPETAPIEIAVSLDRNPKSVPGYTVRRAAHLDTRVSWQLSPPRLRFEEAALDVAARQASELQVIGRLADACQTRRTTARRMLECLEQRARMPHRAWLGGVLHDIADGTCSVLEHGYLDRVERAHCLPRPRRQSPRDSDRGPQFRDIDLEEFGLVVELDGRLFHDSAAQRDLDLDRDLDDAVDGRLSIRLGWGQVFDRSCHTAVQMGHLLQQPGRPGSPQPCGQTCPAAQGGVSEPSSGPESPA